MASLSPAVPLLPPRRRPSRPARALRFPPRASTAFLTLLAGACDPSPVLSAAPPPHASALAQQQLLSLAAHRAAHRPAPLSNAPRYGSFVLRPSLRPRDAPSRGGPTLGTSSLITSIA
ncbi:hypothetical protein AB1Y20_021910 [Prymnesium parvum]|uniref:Uncharacterized protein n=1 Tax=Prymnesium parvum TaxID=97485 RepID=A0AB34JEP1_PRYPA